MITGNSLILAGQIENKYQDIQTQPSFKIKVANESLKPTFNKKDEGLLTGGKSTGRKETMSLKTEGSISTLARPTQVGYFLYSQLGVDASEDIPQTGSDPTKIHKFIAIGNEDTDRLPSMSFFIDRKARNFQYTGVKINSFSFSAQPEDYLKLDINLIGKDEKVIEANKIKDANLLYANQKAFKFRHGKVYIKNDIEIADVTSIKFEYNNNLEQSIQTTGTGLYFKEAEVGQRNIKTDVEMLYTIDTETLREELYKTDDTVKLKLEFISDEAYYTDADGNKSFYKMTITIPCNQVSDATANFGDASAIKQSMSFEAIENGIDELITIELFDDLVDSYSL